MLSQIAWKSAQRILLDMGCEREANRLLDRPEDRDVIIAQVGGKVCNRLGIAKAIEWCQHMTTLTKGPLAQLD